MDTKELEALKSFKFDDNGGVLGPPFSVVLTYMHNDLHVSVSHEVGATLFGEDSHMVMAGAEDWNGIIHLVSYMCLMPFHLLRSSHY